MGVERLFRHPVAMIARVRCDRSRLRAPLLPRLISGKVRVDDLATRFPLSMAAAVQAPLAALEPTGFSREIPCLEPPTIKVIGQLYKTPWQRLRKLRSDWRRLRDDCWTLRGDG